jgi:hypothetical protein
MNVKIKCPSCLEYTCEVHNRKGLKCEAEDCGFTFDPIKNEQERKEKYDSHGNFCYTRKKKKI